MRGTVLSVGLLVVLNISAYARVSEFRIESRKAFPADNHFELLEGHFTGTLDPDDVHNRIINDLKLATWISNGKVAYTATFKLLKPVDMSAASGMLVYDVPNRGHGTVTAFPQGHVSVISGWQGNLAADPALQTISAPVAHNPDGSSIAGPVIARFIDMPPARRHWTSLGGPAAGSAATTSPPQPIRARASSRRQAIQPSLLKYRAALGHLGIARPSHFRASPTLPSCV